MSALETIRKGLKELVAETRRRWRRGGSSGGTGGRAPGAGAELATPRVDIFETPEHVVIFADLPGVKQKGLRIEVVRDVLEITAERADADAARRMSGFVPDGYRASWRLTPSLDAERVDAELRDGVLRLRIPRAESSRPRRIDVRQAS